MLKIFILSSWLYFASVYSYVVHNNTVEKRGPWNGALVHWDGGCKDFANELHVTDDATNKSIQYYIPGTWSMNVVNCWNSECKCFFFTDTNCKNQLSPHSTSGNTDNYACLKDNGQAVRSLICGYIFN